jgi:hypothetical protein
VKKLSILAKNGPKTTTSDRSANQSGLGDGHGGSWFVLGFVFLAGMCHKGLYGGANNSLAAIEEGIDDYKEAPRKKRGRYGLKSSIPF